MRYWMFLLLGSLIGAGMAVAFDFLPAQLLAVTFSVLFAWASGFEYMVGDRK